MILFKKLMNRLNRKLIHLRELMETKSENLERLLNLMSPYFISPKISLIL